MLFFDIETDGLLPDLTKIHCIVIYDSETWKYERYDPANLPVSVGITRLQEADCICGHSIIEFDIPAIQKLHPDFKPRGKVVDTKILSRLIWPNIRDLDFGAYQKGRLPKTFMSYRLAGTHKLEAWGFRLRVYKGDFAKNTDWQKWSPAMSNYCEQDVTVTMRLFEREENKGYSKEAADIEHDVEHIISRQCRNGIGFDKEKAEKLYLELLEKRETLRKELTTLFPPFYKKGKEFTPKRDNKTLHYTAGATCTKIELTDFNPASNQHIYRMLRKKYGWEPVELTPKSGEPKIDDEILGALEYPEAKQLSTFLMLNKRTSQIAEGNEGWLKHTKEGRIYGSVNTLGAVTRRMAHFKPNLGQVPAVYSPYGKECRECFGPREGWKQVGIDADGLEMACLGHFMAPFDNGAFIASFKEGNKKDGTDPHSRNAQSLDRDRDTAKTFFYAYIYGAGNGKLGAICGGNARLGKAMRTKFEKSTPALGLLVDAVKNKVRSHGYLLSLDKHPIPTRSLHSALNRLCQSAGAIVMKKALILFDGMLDSRYGYKPGVDYEFMANVHDEWQTECRPGIEHNIGKLGCEAITAAGKCFNFRCPLSGSYEVGNNWAETH